MRQLAPPLVKLDAPHPPPALRVRSVYAEHPPNGSLALVHYASAAQDDASDPPRLYLAFATVAIALVLLYLAATWGLTHPKIQQANWMLRIIATSSGLQLVLWTLVVAGSVVYVMVASGALIEISNGTLVLLGIIGAAGIASRLHGQRLDGAAAAGRPPPETQVPRWSDLLVPESAADETRAIDVACMQMLIFTLIAAAFVAAKVSVSYTIPDIPEGFQILMGISNALYLGAKVTPG